MGLRMRWGSVSKPRVVSEWMWRWLSYDLADGIRSKGGLFGKGAVLRVESETCGQAGYGEDVLRGG